MSDSLFIFCHFFFFKFSRYHYCHLFVIRQYIYDNLLKYIAVTSQIIKWRLCIIDGNKTLNIIWSKWLLRNVYHKHNTRVCMLLFFFCLVKLTRTDNYYLVVWWNRNKIVAFNMFNDVRSRSDKTIFFALFQNIRVT